MTVGSAALDALAATAIAEDLEVLARLHDREVDAELIGTLRGRPVGQWFMLRLGDPAFDEAARLIELGLAELPDPPDAAALDDLAAEYAAIYLTHAYRVSPCESVWRDEDNLERQEAMFKVRAWYRRAGLTVPDWRRRSEDHLVSELDFLARLMRGAVDAGTAKMAAAFMREHLLVWIPDFAARVVARCRSPFYAGVALLTAAYLGELATVLGHVLGEDMTAVPAKAEVPAGSRPVPTCGDPPSHVAPGSGPSW